ncbi:MAG: RNA chaperone Hfq [Bacillota bacterium]|nr:RNA chaperone Hfq [Bacillota bacterium]
MKEKRVRSRVTPRKVSRVSEDYLMQTEADVCETEFTRRAMAPSRTNGEAVDWIEEAFSDLNHRPDEQPRRRDPANRVQERFLARCVRERTRVEIVTRDEGIRQGTIRAFDRWTLLMEDGDREWLMFKNSILSISRQDDWTLEASLPEYEATVRLLSDVRSHYSDNLAQ